MYTKFIYSLGIFLAFVGVAVIAGGVYDYNTQVCCNGAVFNISKPTTSGGKKAGTGYQCCGNRYIQLKKNQICCNNKAVTVDSALVNTGRASCCGSKVYDYSKQQCCGNTIYNTGSSGNYLSCCKNTTYDYSTQVCCYDSGIVLNITKANCPGSVYFSCCGGQLVGPNQQCCNGVVFNPSITLVTDPIGGYSYNNTAYCCNGGGIVQNPNKEVCCDNGGVIPVNGPNGGCCGSTAYNTSTQICCGNNIYSNTNYGFGCCGNSLYDYNSQTCCNGNVLKGANRGCCGNTTYDYNSELCCNNKVYPKTSPTLSCCYSYNSNPPIPYIDRK